MTVFTHISRGLEAAISAFTPERFVVSQEHRQCVACSKGFPTGEFLVAKGLYRCLRRVTVTGLGLCPTCTKRIADGYIAVIEVAGPENARAPTGTYAYLPAAAWASLFKVPPPSDGLAAVSPETMALVLRIVRFVKKHAQ